MTGDRGDRGQPSPLHQLEEQARDGDSRAADALRALGVVVSGEFEAAAAPPLLPYQPPPNLTLDEVIEPMGVTCHVSPDAGWATLGDFLAGVRERLTIGMYDLTAPHVVKTLEAALGPGARKLHLILDPQGERRQTGRPTNGVKANDVAESTVRERLENLLGSHLEFVWAAVAYKGRTKQAIFPSAYHIKVAVRDGEAFWLSSGNWQSSNQPDLTQLGGDVASLRRIWQRYNREWHVVIEHPGLASLFEGFLQWDIRQAKPLQAALPPPALLPDLLLPAEAATVVPPEAMMLPPGPPKQFAPRRFALTPANPLRVRPLLTPENYATEVLALVRSAKRSICFQNQYISLKQPEEENDPRFLELVDALLERSRAGVDVRIILRDSNAAENVSELRDHGFSIAMIRIQPGCHNKGIVVDGERVLIGSHNWSNSGTLGNRDASLILFDADIAGYYQQVFEWDWNNLARTYSPVAHPTPRIVWPEEPTPEGMVRLRWDDLFED